MSCEEEELQEHEICIMYGWRCAVHNDVHIFLEFFLQQNTLNNIFAFTVIYE